MAVGVRGIYRKWTNIVDDARIITDAGKKLQTPFNFTTDSSTGITRRSS